MQLNGDKALSGPEGDKLGFAATAEAIAAAVLRQSAVDGLVVGIEGRWGSGKSSLVSMIVTALRIKGSGTPPEVVEFKPWLIGDRDRLMRGLFDELAIAVDNIEKDDGDNVEYRRRKLGEVGKTILKFSARLEGAGTLIKAGGVLLPGAGVVGAGLEAGAKAAKGWSGSSSLSSEKNKLRKRLKLLPRKIVVIIDDVDRLEPSEVIEILRLVRSVADFPNIVYIMCYDPSIVAQSIETAANIKDGRSYIEKIVQVALLVPPPEAFDLRHWFSSEIDKLPQYSDEIDTWRSRLSSVIDMEGGKYLKTPRHVVRALDSIRFCWTSLQSKIDFADLVWLHLIKIGNPILYNWIENYLPIAVAKIQGGNFIPDTLKISMRKSLDNALSIDGVDFISYMDRLNEFLPGVERTGMPEKKDVSIFAHVPDLDVARSIKLKRLASPDHYRLYFALEQPKNSPTNADFDALRAALDAPTSETEHLFIKWSSQKKTTGVSKFDAVINQIAIANDDTFGSIDLKKILFACSNVMDDVFKSDDSGFGDPISWTAGREILKSAFNRPHFDRNDVFEVFFHGRALDWLTSLFRREIFSHGRVVQRSSDEKIFDSAELDNITDIMLRRYRDLTTEQWKSLSRPLSALFAWYQGGDPDGPRNMIATGSDTESEFLDLIDLLNSKIHTSDGTYMILTRQNMEYFVDYDEVSDRLKELVVSGAPQISSRASTLVKRLEFGKRH